MQQLKRNCEPCKFNEPTQQANPRHGTTTFGAMLTGRGEGEGAFHVSWLVTVEHNLCSSAMCFVPPHTPCTMTSNAQPRDHDVE